MFGAPGDRRRRENQMEASYDCEGDQGTMTPLDFATIRPTPEIERENYRRFIHSRRAREMADLVILAILRDMGLLPKA